MNLFITKITPNHFLCRSIMLLCALWGSPAKAVTYTFAGGGAWTNAALWSPSYPGTTIAAGDIAITQGYCFFNSGSPALVNNGEIRVLGGELATFGTPFNNFGQVSIESGGSISQMLTNKPGGLVTVTSGFLSNLVNESGATCNIAAGSGMNRFDNFGTITNLGNISINSTTSKVNAGGILYNYNQLIINNNSRLELIGTIDCSNLGQISGSSGGQTDSLLLMGGDLITTGLVQNVTLGVRSDFTASFNTTGCHLNVFAGRTLTISTGSVFTLTGQYWEIYGTLVNDGTIQQSGPFAFSFLRGYQSGSFINNNECQIGELELNNNSSCTNNDILQTERLEIADGASLTNNNYANVTSDMIMSGTSTFNNYGNFEIQSANFYHNSGTLTNYAPNGYINLDADSDWFIGGVVVNHDNIVNEGVIDGNSETSTTAFNNYGLIENMAGASFETPNTFTNHAGSTFENFGTYINTDFNNSFINQGTFNNYSGATFQNESFGGGGAYLQGGIFNQDGTFDQRASSLVYGPLTNGDGLITNGSAQSHNGCPIFADDLVCSSTGTFRVKVATPLNGCNIGYHDRFTIQAPISLDGTLEVMSNPFMQDYFVTVIEASQVVGTFSNVIWPVMPGMYFEVQYTATKVNLRFSTTPLPIELTHFEAKKQDAHVLLAWKTATEVENKGFAIERSTDGRDFVEIGYVRGAGTTTVSTAYRYEDKRLPASPVLYYRLRQEDADGAGYAYSPVRSVKLPFGHVAAIAPNPSTGNLTLQLNSAEETAYSFQIIDSQGRVVKEMPQVAVSKGAQSLPMDLSELPAGVYWLHLRSEQHVEWLRMVLR
jgi:Secretion system C-terminal sorting domain